MIQSPTYKKIQKIKRLYQIIKLIGQVWSLPKDQEICILKISCIQILSQEIFCLALIQNGNMEGFTAQYSSPEQYQLANCHSKKSITKSSDIYSLGLVFMQLTGVDISQKWVFSEKLNGGNYDKCLNPNYEQFNTIIKQMVCYEPEQRLEINAVVLKIKQIIKNEYESNQNQSKIQVLKKAQSNGLLQKKEDSREQTPINLSRNSSNLNILQNSVVEQEEQPKSTIKKLKIIRRPSLKLFQNDIIQQEINKQGNQSPISPQVFKQTIYNQKSGDNTPKLPQIKQNPASFNVSGYFNHAQTPKQIVQNKYSNIKLGFSNVLAQSSYSSDFKESNSNSPLSIYNSPSNSSNSQKFNFRQKTPSQFSNYNQDFDFFQKQQQQELNSPQYKIPLRKIDSTLAVKDFNLPKLKLESNNIHSNIYQEYAIQQNQHKIQKVNGNLLNSSNYFGQKQKQQNHNQFQNQEQGNNQKRRSSSLITFQ
ncbi:kinase domain protein (macronuclear) [Tetrahymena thermophila SB210]|uniref:Kinase domain protein n=1 Tax=Tetrahymena thermophila (strain SB210) TaxID=312017 RepID=I7MDC5_TETTS|nr:kinase domain protein [Tetrahymena thermophila SB210]EAR87326.2 kinase domain protein [Tetrahymena thermophila SB210]|eukprot:XP_001007571.2 kinase domain protein [Tetrahymena thermophila SB210]